MALGFYFNMAHCTGCRACQTACNDRNDNPAHVVFRRVSTYQVGTYPTATRVNYSAACNHCASPACVANCPTGACQQAEDGTVFNDQSVCIGCQTCVNSCPYGHPQYDEANNVSGKCDSCKAFRDNGQNPVCVDACPMRALEFGDLDELRAAHPGELVSELPILPSASETTPSLLVNPNVHVNETPLRLMQYL